MTLSTCTDYQVQSDQDLARFRKWDLTVQQHCGTYQLAAS